MLSLDLVRVRWISQAGISAKATFQHEHGFIRIVFLSPKDASRRISDQKWAKQSNPKGTEPQRNRSNRPLIDPYAWWVYETSPTLAKWNESHIGPQPSQDPSSWIFTSSKECAHTIETCWQSHLWAKLWTFCTSLFRTTLGPTFQQTHDQVRRCQHQEPHPLSSGQLGGCRLNPQGSRVGTTSEVLGDPFSRCSLMRRRLETTKGDGRCWESVRQRNN